MSETTNNCQFTPPFKRNCFLITDSKNREVVHTGVLGRRYGIDDEVTAQMVVDALNANAEPAAELSALTAKLEAAERERDEEICVLRGVNSTLCSGIKRALGLTNWPQIEGDFTRGVVELLTARLALAEAESKANAKRAEELRSGIDDGVTILENYVEDSQTGCQRGYVLAESVNDAKEFLAALLAPANEKEPRHAQ